MGDVSSDHCRLGWKPSSCRKSSQLVLLFTWPENTLDWIICPSILLNSHWHWKFRPKHLLEPTCNSKSWAMSFFFLLSVANVRGVSLFAVPFHGMGLLFIDSCTEETVFGFPKWKQVSYMILHLRPFCFLKDTWTMICLPLDSFQGSMKYNIIHRIKKL